MPELFFIIDEHNDLIFVNSFHKSSGLDYSLTLVKAYASIDILEDEMHTSKRNFYHALEDLGGCIVSAYILPSGYKFLFLNDKRPCLDSFFLDVHLAFKKYIMNPIRGELAKSEKLEREVEEIYARYYAKCDL